MRLEELLRRRKENTAEFAVGTAAIGLAIPVLTGIAVALFGPQARRFLEDVGLTGQEISAGLQRVAADEVIRGLSETAVSTIRENPNLSYGEIGILIRGEFPDLSYEQARQIARHLMNYSTPQDMHGVKPSDIESILDRPLPNTPEERSEQANFLRSWLASWEMFFGFWSSGFEHRASRRGLDRLKEKIERRIEELLGPPPSPA